MPNLWGASPVSRGEGGRSHVTQTVGKVNPRGETRAAQSMAR